jgi:hypothetical protein
MKLIEKHYRSDRGDNPENYQSIDIVQEALRGNEVNGGRQFIRFALVEQRWRSRAEAASYLRWAAKEIENMEGK